MPMKAIKMSDQLHLELTAIVGELTAESGQIKTHEDAVDAVDHRSVVLPTKVIQEIEEFIKNKLQFGYSTKEEFLRGAARWLMDLLRREHTGSPNPKPDSTVLKPKNPSSLEA
jgi:hypothetical protein